MVCFYDYGHDYVMALILVESLAFGFLTFLRMLQKMGTFEVGAHVFYMFKYDLYTLMCLNNHMGPGSGMW